MRSTIKFFIEHPSIANLAVLLTLVLGFIAFSATKVSYFPQVKERFVDVTIGYPGASPEEVEEGIILKVEEELEGVEGIDRVSSSSANSVGRLAVELTEEANADNTLSLVKNAVDKIDNFPAGVESPIVETREVKDLALAFAITGEVSLQAKNDLADEIEKDLLNLPGISDVVVQGAPAQEIEIAVSESALRNYAMTFREVAAAIAQANIEAFGGEVKTGQRNITIKAKDKQYYARDLGNIIVRAAPGGGTIRLNEVATVRDQFVDGPGRRYLGKDAAIVLNVYAHNDENILENAEATGDYIETFNAGHAGVNLQVVEDGSETVADNISSMLSNGIGGFVLVLIVLALFLNRYLAFWVALKIPVVMIGMFLFADSYGMTINVVSLFSFVIALGILVDDGVVVGENIMQWAKKKGITPAKAALEGTMEMVTPVLISLTTTAVAFSLFMFLPTQTGEFFSEMAFVIIAVLGLALLETFFILPSHLAHSKALLGEDQTSRVERWFNGLIDGFNERVYQPVFRTFVNGRRWVPYLTFGIFVALLVGAFGLMGSGVVGFTFFPNLDDKAMFIELELPPGTPTEVTEEKLYVIHDAAVRAKQELVEQTEQDMIKYVEVITGPQSNQGRLRVTFANSEARNLSSFELTNRIRAQAPPIPEATNLVYGIGATTAVFGKPVSFALRGRDLTALRAARDEVKAAMEERDDLKDVSDTDQEGVQEILLSLTPTGEQLGFTLAGVMNQVRAGFFGVQAQSLQRGDEEIKVWLRYPRDGRDSEAQLTDMRVQTPGGGSYPLREVAMVDYNTGNQVINRLDGEREIRVEANLASIESSAPEAIGALQSGILTDVTAKYPTVSYSLEGQNREGEKMGAGVGSVPLVVMLIMLGLIILNFNSFGQAFLTFTLYPFAFIGVIIGHWIQGSPMSIFSIIGAIALIGVFTNNSLVLVSTFNQLLEEGRDFRQAIGEAAASRFRPILLTTVTTVAGLAPLLLSNSLSSQFLKGPAISIAYGLSFGLFNVLVLLPAMLVIINGWRQLAGRLKSLNRHKPNREQVEPAVRAKAFRMGGAAGALIFASATLVAQQGPVLTPEAAVEIAMTGNRQLVTLGYAKQLSANSINPALAGMGPRITIEGGLFFGYADGRTQTVAFGPEQPAPPPLDLSGVNRGVNVVPEASWLVYDGGAGKLRLKQFRVRDEITDARVWEVRHEVASAVATTYLTAARLESQLALARQSAALTRDRLDRTTRLEKYGTVNALAPLRVAADLKTDSANIRNLELQLANVKRSVNLLLGRPAGSEFGLLADFTAPAAPPDLDSLKNQLSQSNPELLRLRRETELALADIDLAATGRRPTLQLYANASYLNQQNDASFLLENRIYAAEAGARASYTLFDNGLNKVQRQNARIAAEQSRATTEAAAFDLENRLEIAYANYLNARSQLAFERRNLPVFEAAAERAAVEFANGQADATTVRSAQLDLLASRTRIVQERFGILEALVELERIVGGTL